MKIFYVIQEKDLDNYLDSHGLNPDQCWVFRKPFSLKSNHVISLMKIMVKKAKTLEKMVILRLKGYLEGRDFVELLRIVPMLSRPATTMEIVLS